MRVLQTTTIDDDDDRRQRPYSLAPYTLIDPVRQIFIKRRFTVDSKDRQSRESSGHDSVPCNKIGKHSACSKASTHSSEAARPTLPYTASNAREIEIWYCRMHILACVHSQSKFKYLQLLTHFKVPSNFELSSTQSALNLGPNQIPL